MVGLFCGLLWVIAVLGVVAYYCGCFGLCSGLIIVVNSVVGVLVLFACIVAVCMSYFVVRGCCVLVWMVAG